MKVRYLVAFFGTIEILIGAITFLNVVLSIILGVSTKSLEVTVFVLVTGALSFSLGLGLLRNNRTAYHLLIFFSLIIVFSKLLIFTKIITLNGALETTIPAYFKNIISILYHTLIIIYFVRREVRCHFGERRNVILSLKNPLCK